MPSAVWQLKWNLDKALINNYADFLWNCAAFSRCQLVSSLPLLPSFLLPFSVWTSPHLACLHEPPTGNQEFRWFTGGDSSQLCDLCLGGALQSLRFPRCPPPLPFLPRSVSQLLFSFSLSFLCHLPHRASGLPAERHAPKADEIRPSVHVSFILNRLCNCTTVAMREMRLCVLVVYSTHTAGCGSVWLSLCLISTPALRQGASSLKSTAAAVEYKTGQRRRAA